MIGVYIQIDEAASGNLPLMFEIDAAGNVVDCKFAINCRRDVHFFGRYDIATQASTIHPLFAMSVSIPYRVRNIVKNTHVEMAEAVDVNICR